MIKQVAGWCLVSSIPHSLWIPECIKWGGKPEKKITTRKTVKKLLSQRLFIFKVFEQSIILHQFKLEKNDQTRHFSRASSNLGNAFFFFTLHLQWHYPNTLYFSSSPFEEKKKSTFIIEQLVRLPRLFLPLSKNLKAKSIKKKYIYKLSI